LATITDDIVSFLAVPDFVSPNPDRHPPPAPRLSPRRRARPRRRQTPQSRQKRHSRVATNVGGGP
jgi:hypothetical protein